MCVAMASQTDGSSMVVVKHKDTQILPQTQSGRTLSICIFQHTLEDSAHADIENHCSLSL